MLAKAKDFFRYFTRTEKILWAVSVFFIVCSSLMFDKVNYSSVISSVVGVTAIIFIAKGNPIGQLIMLVFSITYGIISLSFAYYGEMITYLGMTAPMAVLSLISWLKNPYKNSKKEVRVSSIGKKEFYLMIVGAVVVTVAFYYILKFFHTANLLMSTFSILTSFTAAYLTMRRSPYFALAYVLNDIVLIGMWIMATISDISYISVVICFIAFLFNDSYSFINWKRMEKRQAEG